MALFRGIQEYIALDANNITLVFDSGNIVNISGNIFLYPPQGHPLSYNYSTCRTIPVWEWAVDRDQSDARQRSSCRRSKPVRLTCVTVMSESHDIASPRR